MTTITVRELRNHYGSVLDRVEAGEEIAISRHGKIVARLVPEKAPIKIDWTQSAAFKMNRKGRRILTAKESAELLAENRGKY